MANRVPEWGDFSIPSDVFTTHEWMTDSLIDGETGHTCTLYYPEKRQPCDNCVFDPQTERSSNIYKAGGPIVFTNNTICPRCQGRGFLSLAETETIQLRIYWDQAAWRNIGIHVADPNGSCVAIGYMSDLPKLERSTRIQIHTELNDMRRYMCVREGEAQPHGFRKNRYFIQTLKRTGGG